LAVNRRLGSENAKNRECLVEAAKQLLHEEGYAALTARRVAERAGLKTQLVHYYFSTMDDVIIAVVRDNAAARMQNLTNAFSSSEPLRALWEVNSDPVAAIIASELLALANHRESIRDEIVRSARQLRSFQIDAVSKILSERKLKDIGVPAGAIVTLSTALGRALARDCALGVSEGYAEALMVLERCLRVVRDAPSNEEENPPSPVDLD
jgi:TetR/AcrR family transcriptional regulator